MAPEDSDVLVRSVVKKTDGGEPVQVDYGMEKTDAGWKVYNVKVGGISLVESYRSTFNSEIGKNGIDGLVKMLKDKNRTFSMSQK
jgi:phospholipid transport system substrate-binding protein